jgi:CheY-like chemotaxis protein
MARPRVLVIEDDPAHQRLLRHVLEPAGYAVTAADSALGAKTLVRRLRPRAILLDLGLPYRSGAALLAELKADPRTAGVPVLVVSAMSEVLPAERRGRRPRSSRSRSRPGSSFRRSARPWARPASRASRPTRTSMRRPAGARPPTDGTSHPTRAPDPTARPAAPRPRAAIPAARSAAP